MNTAALIKRMETFPSVLAVLTANLSEEESHWKPESGAWSIVEIVCHLADEEVLDFRARVDATLHDPEAPWEPIDPEGWATQRKYNEQDLGEAVTRFMAERADSVSWLRLHLNPDWSNTHLHPKGWKLSAGDLLASWAAHDALHLRQIAKRFYELAQRDTDGYSTEYAGSF